MAGALFVHAPICWWALRRPAPLLADRYQVPTRRDLDTPLFAGAALFGLGWGISGYCPGPALVALAAGPSGAVVFVAAMVAGMGVQRLVR